MSGPCDEPEHANDPRCTGADTGVDDDRAPAGTNAGTTTGAGDISGPCDEPEHANDARCTGAGASTADDDDHSGPGSDDGHDNAGPAGSDDDSGSGSDDD